MKEKTVRWRNLPTYTTRRRNYTRISKVTSVWVDRRWRIACEQLRAALNDSIMTMQNLTFDGVFTSDSLSEIYMHTYNFKYPKRQIRMKCMFSTDPANHGNAKFAVDSSTNVCTCSIRWTRNAVICVRFTFPFLS